MTRERMVPYGGLAFIVVAALTLATLIIRTPDTHGHLWRTLPADYDRTPVDDMAPADLQVVLADLPPFSFPKPEKVAARVEEAGDKAADTGSAQVAAAEQEAQEAEIVQTEFAITPDRLTLKVGVPVEMTVKNEGKQVHGLWMPDFGIAEDIRSGRTEVFRFTPDKPGRFRYTCSYSLCGTEKQHAQMAGFLTVTE